MKDEMTDIEKLQNFWMKQYAKQSPTFKDFSRTVKAYIPKHKWQKILPYWMLKLFVKPTTFYNCFPKAIDGMCDEIRNTGYIGLIEIEAKPKESFVNIQRLIAFYKSKGLKVV